MKYAKMMLTVSMVSMLASCSSTSGPETSTANKEPVDIYDQLRNDNVQYATEEQEAVKGSPEYVIKNLSEVRAAYFKKNYEHSAKIAKRILSVAPATAEAYYWLARIAVDKNDFDQAYNMATRGLSYAKEPSMKAELKRMQTMTQMGAK